MSYEYYGKELNISELVGQTLVKVENTGDEVIFETTEGVIYKMYHSQDCCENVRVEEVIGDLEDLIGNPILKAEEVHNADNPEAYDYSNLESFTWTFYHLATIKGYVTIRWLGESNGYYSESVDFVKV